MDFALSKELEMLRKAVREFATKKIAPYADEWDANHYLPYKEAVKPMGELGFFGTVIPEEYDGEDMGWLAAMIVTEEIARASSSLRVQVNMQVLGCAFTIYKYGSEALSKKYKEADFVKINVDNNPGVAYKLNVQGVPTFAILRGNKLIAKIVGADMRKVENKIKEAIKNS